MANRYPKAQAETLVSGYIKTIEYQRDLIWQNYMDMDLDNADVKQEFREIAGNMTKICDNLIDEINKVSFE